jgi:hypothetical protein
VFHTTIRFDLERKDIFILLLSTKVLLSKIFAGVFITLKLFRGTFLNLFDGDSNNVVKNKIYEVSSCQYVTGYISPYLCYLEMAASLRTAKVTAIAADNPNNFIITQ